ncbi:hypothetical protein AB4Y96_01610 [Phyllobacterium sp. TAF24]|uniref:hypothetical protein n=1 Tax=unclassified Phyllobacterium TaxID=2638441 RepID=UPI00111390AC|nr:hypothetical protein [Phyllobacterium sp. OV277]
MTEAELLAAQNYWFEYKYDHQAYGLEYGAADRYLKLITTLLARFRTGIPAFTALTSVDILSMLADADQLLEMVFS